jgi:hypothetical protein
VEELAVAGLGGAEVRRGVAWQGRQRKGSAVVSSAWVGATARVEALAAPERV